MTMMAVTAMTVLALSKGGSSCRRESLYPAEDHNFLIVGLMVDGDASSEASQCATLV